MIETSAGTPSLFSDGDWIVTTEGLVSGDYKDSKHDVFPILSSDVPLSFWGGIDELTGIVIDTSHPLCGKNVSGTILVLPSGRGSCTASQVLLELILNRKAPRALVLRDRDGLVCVGALVAQSCVLADRNTNIPVLDIVRVTDPSDASISAIGNTAAFDTLVERRPQYGNLLPDGRLVTGKNEIEVKERLDQLVSGRSNDNSFGVIDNDCQVDFTAEEKQMLENSLTPAERRAMEVLIRYAHIVTPPGTLPTYIDVNRAHIDGCTYIGPGGLQFVEGLVQDGGAVKIPTTLNSVSTDLRFWERLGIHDNTSNRNAIRQANAYVSLGCSSKSFTCAPYLLEGVTGTDGNDVGIPEQNDQIVWGESNAVVYANTVLGARTEKYADYLDICCAITGKVPLIGVHQDEPRIPTLTLNLEEKLFEGISSSSEESFSLLFPVLGHLCGSLSDGEVPLLIGLETFRDRITKDHLKAFCAAFGTTAASPLIHIAGVTPEACDADISEWMQGSLQSKIITAELLQETLDLLDQKRQQQQDSEEAKEMPNDKIDLVALGNPHLSLSEVDELLQLIQHESKSHGLNKKNDNVDLVACISRALYDQSPNVKTLEEFGVTFVQDTCWCMLLEPPMIPSDPNATILTNSGKYAHYGPGLTGRRFRFGSMKDCVRAAWTGALPKRLNGQNVPWRKSSHDGTTRSYSSFTTSPRSRFGIRSPLGWKSNATSLLRHISRVVR